MVSPGPKIVRNGCDKLGHGEAARVWAAADAMEWEMVWIEREGSTPPPAQRCYETTRTRNVEHARLLVWWSILGKATLYCSKDEKAGRGRNTRPGDRQ